MQTIRETPVFVLCGGKGTRLREQTQFYPKPMVQIGKRPILLHIMRWYAGFGFRKFVLCLGFKADVIRQYFLNYAAMSHDFTAELRSGNIAIHRLKEDDDWEVTLAYTGERAMTGARVARACGRYLDDAEHFAVTYGDGLTDADLKAEFESHLTGGKIGTVLGVNPPSRFGEIRSQGDKVTEFVEKPRFDQVWVNAGYFFFRRDFCRYLSDEDDCILEEDPLVRLAGDGQLKIYRHRGFWACMDTQRDKEYLDRLWEAGNAAWLPPGQTS